MNRRTLLVGAVVGVAVLGMAWSPARPLQNLFTWAELSVSETAERLGLENSPTLEAQRALAVLVSQVLGPLRAVFGTRLQITSGYRSAAVNEAVDGAAGSQHMRGEAVDFVVDGVLAERVAALVVASGMPFDQLIWYAPERGGHVHVSLTTTRTNRRQVLFAPIGGGYTAAAVGRV